MGPIVSHAPLGVAQHLPSRVELKDPMLVAAGIRMVLFNEGAIGGLDLSRASRCGHSQHLIGIASRQRPGQGSRKSTPILAPPPQGGRQAIDQGRDSTTDGTKKPPADAGGSGFWCVSVREERVRSN